MSILKYFQRVPKPLDGLPDPNGLLSSKLPPSAIQQANNYVREFHDLVLSLR